MNLLESKKGAIPGDILVIVIFLFVFGVSSIMSMALMLGLIQGWTDAGLYVGDIKEAGDSFLAGLSVLDYITVILLMVFIVGIGVTTYRLNTPPIFFIVMFVLSAGMGFISYFFSYFFQNFASQSALTAANYFFPRTIIICTNLHWVALVAIVIGSITLFGKKEKGAQLANE